MARRDPSRRPRWRFILALAVVVAALVVLQSGGTTLVVNKEIDPDLIVSLASHEWERLPETARLATRYPRAKVLLTKPPVVSRLNCHDCEHRLDYLASQGIARDRMDVVMLGESSTRGEAEGVLAMVRALGYRRLLLVTSTYHTRRALRTFRRVFGTQAELGVVPAGEGAFAFPRRWWSRPYDRWYVTYEWTALTRDLMREAVGG